MRKTLIFLIIIFVYLRLSFAESIVNSKHNLSLSGSGKVHSATENEVCIFCHAPHNASSQAPLWNRFDSGQVYTPYSSSTIKASVGQPTGASKLCLSCHDGTIALGLVRSRSSVIPMGSLIGGSDNLGTDLSDDHPVSFRYDSSLASKDKQLKDPATLSGSIRLDKDSQLQCTSCHDPHDDQFGNFLRVSALRGAMCQACHNMQGWGNSVHKNYSAFWNGQSTNPWPHTSWNNVSDNACENCHNPHNAAGKKLLLNFSAFQDNCTVCHNGNVAHANILAELNKTSAHSTNLSTGLHDAAEDALVSSKRHVECVDCHNPHAAAISSDSTIPRSLKGVKGVNASGVAASEISYEFELCFRCHADSNNIARRYTNPQFIENNVRLQFATSNSSYHPLENIGKNANVPSLISPLTVSSKIKCTDCHNNNSGTGNGGTGPKGPHGSIYRPILERNLSFADNQQESSSAYSLCYKCHDRNNILGNKSFSKHKKHIVDQRAPCTACHDAHGVKTAAHLINFDRNIVSANSSGSLSYNDSGRYHGSCSLKCHGYNHNNLSY